MRKITLKACPFCGGAPSPLMQRFVNGNIYAYGCSSCNCFVGVTFIGNTVQAIYTSKEAAANAWNKRTESDMEYEDSRYGI